MSVNDADDLPFVMEEIRDALSAESVVLTVHPDGGAVSPIHVDKIAGADEELLGQLLANESLTANRGSEVHRWINIERAGSSTNIFLIPVTRVDGQSRLTISALFGHLTATQRNAVEEVYLQRRPFAVGYFRLWQLDRVRTRRVEALETALNLNAMGIFVLDRSGDLLFANEAGNALLDGGDGLRRHRTSLRATQLSDSLRLQVALDHVIEIHAAESRQPGSSRRAPLIALHRQGKSPLIVSVLPTERPATDSSDAAAIMFVLDPVEDIDRLIQPLCGLYRLSPVEARLAMLLAKGNTIATASEVLQLKEQTARGYLKQVFVKTGTNRQSELVRLLMSSVIHTSSTVLPQIM